MRIMKLRMLYLSERGQCTAYLYDHVCLMDSTHKDEQWPCGACQLGVGGVIEETKMGGGWKTRDGLKGKPGNSTEIGSCPSLPGERPRAESSGVELARLSLFAIDHHRRRALPPSFRLACPDAHSRGGSRARMAVLGHAELIPAGVLV